MCNSVRCFKLRKQSYEFIFIEFPSTQFLNVWVDVEHIFHSHSMFTCLTRMRIKVFELHNNIFIAPLYVTASSCNLCRLWCMYEAVRAVSRKGKEWWIWGEGENEDLIWTSDVVIIKHTTHRPDSKNEERRMGCRKTRGKLARWLQEFMKMYAITSFDDSICQIKKRTDNPRRGKGG
jgi:hypothetical protein